MNFRGIYTLFYKELKRINSVKSQTILAPAVSNLLFLLVFGITLSGRASPLEGLGYMAFLIPGLAAMGCITNSLQNPMTSLIIAKYTNGIIELLMIPLKGFEISLAYLAAAILRGFIVAATTVIVGMFFTSLPFAHPILMILFTILLGAIFGSLGIIIGIVAKEFDQASIIPTFVLTPLIYLGGTFYAVSSLPAPFSTISQFNPLYYLIDGYRFTFLGVSENPFLLSLTITVSLFIIFFSLASLMLQKGYRLKD